MKKFNRKRTKYLKYLNLVLSLFYHTKNCYTPISKEDITKIIIIDFTNIGDMIMLIPFLKIINKNCPYVEISLVCNSWGKTVLEKLGIVKRFIIFDGAKALDTPLLMLKNNIKLQKIYSEINNSFYDIALEPRGDLRYIFFMHHIKAKRKISYDYTGGQMFLTDIIIPSPSVNHLIDDKLYFLKKLGFTYGIEDTIPHLKLSSVEADLNTQFYEDNKIVYRYKVTGIHPGASKTNRQWCYFDKLVEILFKIDKEQIFLVFQGPGEEAIAQSVYNYGSKLGAHIFLVKENLENYIRILASCSRVICNDSGAAHIAAAYGIPVTIIYGPACPETCSPRGSGVIEIVSHDMKCKPCFSSTCLTGNLECLRGIKPEEVIRKIPNFKERN